MQAKVVAAVRKKELIRGLEVARSDLTCRMAQFTHGFTEDQGYALFVYKRPAPGQRREGAKGMAANSLGSPHPGAVRASHRLVTRVAFALAALAALAFVLVIWAFFSPGGFSTKATQLLLEACLIYLIFALRDDTRGSETEGGLR